MEATIMATISTDFGFWILRMCELFGFPDSGAHQAGFWIEEEILVGLILG
jgi:hypothetical protein